jgi:hypothetical protein
VGPCGGDRIESHPNLRPTDLLFVKNNIRTKAFTEIPDAPIIPKIQ